MYKILGFGFIGLAALGAILPILPTTPFLLLAAGCFAKSSSTLHRKLLEDPTFGPAIRDWQENRTISRKSRNLALSMIIFFGGASVIFAVPTALLKVICLGILAYGIFFILGIKIKHENPGEKNRLF